ncbi:5-oxoprolinase subunit PxpA [Maribacter sp. CXY002]|uniref:5-oxoprolinase subunit PxpA n=1 Tax=Maribacter luteocoastalis TaxID=3407671 RepID=UPI003B66DC45
MEKILIDINADVGEGIGNESQLMPFLSSCNIACGGHAGDIDSIKEVVVLAKKHNIKIGAHPSYPDKANFGRISMDLSPKEFEDTIQSQIAVLVSICETEKVQLNHIKPHGALYNDLAWKENLILQFLKVVEKYKSSCLLYVPYASVMERMAVEQNFKIKREAFGDRNYNSDYSLVSRANANAVIVEPYKVVEHLIAMIRYNHVNTISKEKIRMKADTFCIHGDTPNALQILTYLSNELPKHNIFLNK